MSNCPYFKRDTLPQSLEVSAADLDAKIFIRALKRQALPSSEEPDMTLLLPIEYVDIWSVCRAVAIRFQVVRFVLRE